MDQPESSAAKPNCAMDTSARVATLKRTELTLPYSLLHPLQLPAGRKNITARGWCFERNAGTRI